MFKDLYRKVDAKIEPDLKLVKDTKAKMMEELNQKKKIKYIHFSRYATVAACFILVVGLATMNITKTANQSVQALGGNASSSVDPLSKGEVNHYTGSSFDSISTNSSSSTNSGGHALPNVNAYFSSSNNSLQSTADSAQSIRSIGGNVIQFFLNILQWFKELLF